MRLLLLMLGISVCVGRIGTRADAQNYPWCDLQRWDGRRRYKLRLHNISTVHGHRAGARQLLSTEHAIPAATRTTRLYWIPKTLSVLSANIATASAIALAAWRYSPQSAAPRRC
jgi:hypothetical protein